MIGRAYPITFPCCDHTLIGIVHPGEAAATLAVVVVVGGPQYRVGSHRQFVQLARYLSGRGFPVLRFDTRGMGDSGGSFPGFEAIACDIRAAIDAAARELPQVRRFVLWGLCDAASAILFYASGDARVVGVSLANPWVRTESSVSRTRLRHYYVARLLRPDFWRRLITGDVRIGDAVVSFFATMRGALAVGKRGGGKADTNETGPPLSERMASGFAAFGGNALVLVSGGDLTAREFVDATRRSPVWERELARPNVVWHDIPGADHTFSRRDWEEHVAVQTGNWIESFAVAAGEADATMDFP